MSQESPPQDPFELLKKMWAPMGLPMPGAMAPFLDINEVEKRIADLKSVEGWLTMNMNVLRMTIQGLEMQRATLAAFQAMQPPPGAPPSSQSKPDAAPPPSAADAWWTLLQQMQSAPPQPPQPEAKPEKKGK